MEQPRVHPTVPYEYPTWTPHHQGESHHSPPTKRSIAVFKIFYEYIPYSSTRTVLVLYCTVLYLYSYSTRINSDRALLVVGAMSVTCRLLVVDLSGVNESNMSGYAGRRNVFPRPVLSKPIY